jgi:hypothetical protein
MGIELAIGAIAAGIGAGTTFSVAAGLTIGFSWVAAAVSFGLGVLQSIMTPKPKANNFSGGAAIKDGGTTQNIRQAITSRRTIYGEVRVGGAITYLETTVDDKFLHMILTIADHECQEIGEIWFDDVSIPVDALDGSGVVTSGTYANKARIKKYLGTDSQTADSDLVSETSRDSNFRGRGITYIYVRLEYDRNVFPGRIPVLTAFVKGKKLFDPRDDGVRYSANTIMFVNDYITSPVDSFTPGVGAAQSKVQTTAFTAAVNICEEMVETSDVTDTILSASASLDTLTLTGVNDRLQYQTGDRVTLSGASLPGGTAELTEYYVIPYQRKDSVRIKLATSLANALAGTAVNITSSGTGTIRKNAEPRYFGGGIVQTSEEPKTNLENLLSASGGSATYIGGKWVLKAAAYSTPVFTFDESHIISRITLRTKVSRRERFNLVKGVYVSPLNDGETSDYPPVTNSTYVASDNDKTLPIDHDLAYTQRPHTAQRLAKIKLEKHRQELFFEAEFKLHAMQVQPGDTVYINNTRMGWTNKVFEVITWTLAVKKIGNTPLFYVKMALQETASANYDWNNGEETAVDPAPNTNLRNPGIVQVVVGFSLDSLPVFTQDEDRVYNILASWDAHEDPYVNPAGMYEIFYKKSTESVFKSAGKVDGLTTQTILPTLEPDVLYDIQIIAYNNLGVPSQPTLIEDFKVGTTVTTDTEDWENETLTTEDWESDSLSSQDWET